MEDTSPCGTSNSERKTLEALSDSDISIRSTRLSENQQNNEGDNMDDAADGQKIPVEGHDIKEEEEEDDEEEDYISELELLVQMGYAEPEPKGEIRKELERESSDEEERREDDDNEPLRQEPVTAQIADLKLVSALKGSRKNEDKPVKAVTWSPTLEEFAPSENETDTSHNQVKCTRKNKQKGGGKSAGEGASKSNDRGGRKGVGKNKKKGKKHGGSSSK